MQRLWAEAVGGGCRGCDRQSGEGVRGVAETEIVGDGELSRDEMRRGDEQTSSRVGVGGCKHVPLPARETRRPPEKGPGAAPALAWRSLQSKHSLAQSLEQSWASGPSLRLQTKTTTAATAIVAPIVIIVYLQRLQRIVEAKRPLLAYKVHHKRCRRNSSVPLR